MKFSVVQSIKTLSYSNTPSKLIRHAYSILPTIHSTKRVPFTARKAYPPLHEKRILSSTTRKHILHYKRVPSTRQKTYPPLQTCTLHYKCVPSTRQNTHPPQESCTLHSKYIHSYTVYPNFGTNHSS